MCVCVQVEIEWLTHQCSSCRADRSPRSLGRRRLRGFQSPWYLMKKFGTRVLSVIRVTGLSQITGGHTPWFDYHAFSEFLLIIVAMNNGPLISSAGRNHVLLSKQFCILLSAYRMTGRVYDWDVLSMCFKPRWMETTSSTTIISHSTHSLYLTYFQLSCCCAEPFCFIVHSRWRWSGHTSTESMWSNKMRCWRKRMMKWSRPKSNLKPMSKSRFLEVKKKKKKRWKDCVEHTPYPCSPPLPSPHFNYSLLFHLSSLLSGKKKWKTGMCLAGGRRRRREREREKEKKQTQM